MTAKHLAVLVTLVLCITASLPAASQSGNDYDLAWYSVDNGGATFSTNDGYQLGGAIGQPDAGTLIGGQYTLAGGFWQGETAVSDTYRVYLPLVLRQAP